MGLTLPLIILLSAAIVAALAHFERRRQLTTREARLKQRIGSVAVASKPPPATAPTPARVRPLPSTFRFASDLDRWLMQAGVGLSGREFLELTLLFGLIGVALAAMRSNLPAAMLYALCPAVLPPIYAALRRKQRLSKFSQQLPFVLDFLRSSLGAGHTLQRGLQLAAESSPDPIAAELKLALERVEVGSSIADALESMFKRVPEESLGFLVVAVRIQLQVGSGMAEILERVTEAIRNRQRLQKEVRALTAQGRMSGIMVGLLPAVVLVAFSVLRPEYTWPLFHERAGIHLLEIAVTLDVVAYFIIRWIVKID